VGRWKSNAKEYTVRVSYVEGRGYQLYFPVPLMERWGRPDRLTFRPKGDHATVKPATESPDPERKKGPVSERGTK